MLRLPVILDINHKAIRGLNFKYGFGGFSIVHGNSLAFNKLSPEEFGQDLLTTFIKRHYPYNVGVFINLPYETSFTREITLPFKEKKKVQEVLNYELESLLPYALEEFVYDYYLYPDPEKNMTRVVVAGADKKSLLPYLEILKENKILVLGIYSPLDSLYHLQKFTNQKDCLMLHISSMSSMVLVVKDNQWIFSRIIPLGYDNLVYWLAKRWKKSFEESEKLFLSLPLEEGSGPNFKYFKNQFNITRSNFKLFSQGIEEFGNALEGELRLTLRSTPALTYEELKNKTPIVVSSDLKNQTVLEGILIRKVENPIMSFPYEKTPMATMPKEQLINFGGVVSQQSKGFNFLQKELKKYISMGQYGNKRPFYISLSIALFLFIASFFIEVIGRMQAADDFRSQNQIVFEKFFKEKPSSKDINLLEESKKKVQMLKRKTEIFNVFFRGKNFSEILLELNNVLSAEGILEINYVAYSNTKLKFNGASNSSSSISEFKQIAEDSEIFESINCSQKTSPSKFGGKAWKFQCILNIKAVAKK